MIFIFCGCASHFGEGWSKADTTRQAAYTMLHIQDWRQTIEIANHHDKYKELNPILGPRPSRHDVDIYMASTLILNPIIAASLKPKYRKWFQWTGIGIEAYCVGNNFAIGLSGEF